MHVKEIAYMNKDIGKINVMMLSVHMKVIFDLHIKSYVEESVAKFWNSLPLKYRLCARYMSDNKNGRKFT